MPGTRLLECQSPCSRQEWEGVARHRPFSNSFESCIGESDPSLHPPKKKGPNEYFIARASEAAESEWKIFDVWQVGAQKLATRRATAVLGAHWVTEHSGRSGESTWPGKEFHCSCSSICISYQCFAHRAEKVQDPFVAHGHLLWSLWDCACHGTKENIFGGPCSRCWGGRSFARLTHQRSHFGCAKSSMVDLMRRFIFYCSPVARTASKCYIKINSHINIFTFYFL